nr:hypothetical protein [Anoxybacter fermentans]
MFKCSVCNFIYEREAAPEQCPKCGAPKEKFIEISEEVKEKILRSRYTNDLHMEIKTLLDTIIELAEEGIEDDLDPGCVKVFKEAKAIAFELGQKIKAELEGHMKKGKWG